MKAQKVMTSNAFKEIFKQYKRRQPPPDLSQVIDFKKIPHDYRIIEHSLKDPPPSIPRPYGARPIDQLHMYSISNLPGFFIIPNALTDLGQHFWMLRCLKQLPNVPHKCNLDLHLTAPREEDSSLFDESKDVFEKSSKQRSDLYSLAIYKLRWVTLGYHYDWTSKIYQDDDFTPFPLDMGDLARYIASAIGYSDDYRAEAAIINYYHSDSTLSGHTDHSEKDLQAPLLSVSLGLDAIFLLGGQTLEDVPTAIYLRTGDIVILWKEARLAYHGVPRIFENTCMSPLEDIVIEDASVLPDCIVDEIDSYTEERNKSAGKMLVKDPQTPEYLRYQMGHSFYEHYLKYTRINMNIRQVNIHKDEECNIKTPVKRQKLS